MVFRLTVVVSLVHLMITPVSAETSKPDWVESQYQEILADPVKLKQAYEAGRERSTICSYCHGSDGNSLKPEMPNLAGQNPIYLWKQIDHFATGKRKNFVMQALAEKFTNKDKLNLSIYYSLNVVKSPSADPELAKKGKNIYVAACLACHGVTGGGNKDVARVAGQKPNYITLTLTNFRENANSELKASDSTRRSAVMEGVVKNMPDSALVELAAYISSMP